MSDTILKDNENFAFEREVRSLFRQVIGWESQSKDYVSSAIANVVVGVVLLLWAALIIWIDSIGPLSGVLLMLGLVSIVFGCRKFISGRRGNRAYEEYCMRFEKRISFEAGDIFEWEGQRFRCTSDGAFYPRSLTDTELPKKVSQRLVFTKNPPEDLGGQMPSFSFTFILFFDREKVFDDKEKEALDNLLEEWTRPFLQELDDMFQQKKRITESKLNEKMKQWEVTLRERPDMLDVRVDCSICTI